MAALGAKSNRFPSLTLTRNRMVKATTKMSVTISKIASSMKQAAARLSRQFKARMSSKTLKICQIKSHLPLHRSYSYQIPVQMAKKVQLNSRSLSLTIQKIET